MRSPFRETYLPVLLAISLSVFILHAHYAVAAVDEYDSSPTMVSVAKEAPPPQAAASNGLYSTITGYLKVKNVHVPNQRGMSLQVAGFAQPVPVFAVIQEQPAPLVVVLLGVSGKASADFSRLWPSWYAQAGFHVLTFDSTFRPEFVDISGHGVSGNIWAESDRVAQIIAAFLQHPQMQGKATKTGVVGMSYGAVQALILGQRALEGRLPFKLAAIQAYSPPIRLEATAELLDRWFAEDRWKFTLIELQRKVGKHAPVSESAPVPLPEDMMRASIAAAFRAELSSVVLRNDEKFQLAVLPHGNEFDDKYVRRDYADSWGFVKYALDLAIPYWRTRAGYEDMEQRIRATNACELVSQQPGSSKIFLAADDPFNLPEDVERLKACAAREQLTVWPRGGHMGYIGDARTRETLLALFEQARVAAK